MDQEVSQGTRPIGGDPAADAGAGTGRLGDQAGDRDDCRHAGHALHPRSGSGDILHPVPAQAGRYARSRSGLRHHAVHAARFGSADGSLPQQDPPGTVPPQRERDAVLGRGRVPGCLRQRADGDDLQGFLRRPLARAAGLYHRQVRSGASRGRNAGPTGQAHLLGAGGRADQPDRGNQAGGQGRCEGLRQGKIPGCNQGRASESSCDGNRDKVSRQGQGQCEG